MSFIWTTSLEVHSYGEIAGFVLIENNLGLPASQIEIKVCSSSSHDGALKKDTTCLELVVKRNKAVPFGFPQKEIPEGQARLLTFYRIVKQGVPCPLDFLPEAQTSKELLIFEEKFLFSSKSGSFR